MVRFVTNKLSLALGGGCLWVEQETCRKSLWGDAGLDQVMRVKAGASLLQ